MPVPIAKLQEAQRPLKDRALEVLEADPKQGFSVLDVDAAIEARATGLSAEVSALILALSPLDVRAARLKPLGDLLEKLATEGKVSKYLYSGEPYYAAAAR